IYLNIPMLVMIDQYLQPSLEVQKQQYPNRPECPGLSSYKTHKIIERFGLEETLKVMYFKPPYHGQGNLSLDQVTQSPIQPDLGHLQGVHNFSGQPVLVPHHFHHNEFLLNI
ncbi:hypothetical protein HGM15179_001463, partial [Zosterops borbonicus]